MMSDDPEHLKKDQHHQHGDDRNSNRVTHNYSSCLMCQTGRHELCLVAKGGWVTQGKRRYFVTQCQCAAQGHGGH